MRLWHYRALKLDERKPIADGYYLDAEPFKRYIIQTGLAKRGEFRLEREHRKLWFPVKDADAGDGPVT